MQSLINTSVQPFTALAFKIMTDEGRKLTYLRVYSGILKAEQDVYNSTKGKRERIARIFRMHANKKERIAEVKAGDRRAVDLAHEQRTGTLRSERKRLIGLADQHNFLGARGQRLRGRRHLDLVGIDPGVPRLHPLVPAGKEA